LALLGLCREFGDGGGGGRDDDDDELLFVIGVKSLLLDESEEIPDDVVEPDSHVANGCNEFLQHTHAHVISN
jgi:hypothetical protein